MSVGQSFTWCIESHNRRKDGSDPLNPTNDIVIPTKMPAQRMAVMQMTLGSVELPNSQYLIEKTNNTLYFDEGINLIANSAANQCVREFTVLVNNIPITAILPLYLNRITHVDVTNPASPIFTTEFDHALELRSQWNWGAPIQVISTPLTSVSEIYLTDTNHHLTILSDTQFQLRGIMVVPYTSVDGTFGYVWAPTIPSPAYLARIVNNALNAVSPNEFELTYDINTGRFTFRSIKTVSSTCLSNPPLSNTDTIHIQITSQSCLPALMGFGCGTVPVCVPPSVCDVPENCDPHCTLTGTFGYQCFSKIVLYSGDYTPDTMGVQLNLQWSRFFIDGGTANAALLRPIFVFSAANGAPVVIAIEYGLYTADTFAEYLQNQMNANDPLGNTYTVSYNAITGLFCFQNNQGTEFGLEFNDPLETFNPAVIGFDAISYRGQNTYCSTTSFFVPTTGCCGSSSIPSRFLSNVYHARINPAQHTFSINVNKPRCITPGFIQDLGGGIVKLYTLLTITTPLLALGYQPEDVVEVQVGGQSYLLRILEIIDAFSVIAEMGSAPFTGFIQHAASFCLAGLTISNLLFGDTTRPNRFIPNIIGFRNRDVLWNPTIPQPPFASPYIWDFDPPNHILLTLPMTEGSTHVNHAWDNSNIQVFAKIILWPKVRVDRVFPMVMDIPDVKIIESIRFLFLNADHTAYQFHDREWSATIVFAVPQATGQYVCY